MVAGHIVVLILALEERVEERLNSKHVIELEILAMDQGRQIQSQKNNVKENDCHLSTPLWRSLYMRSENHVGYGWSWLPMPETNYTPTMVVKSLFTVINVPDDGGVLKPSD